MYWNDALGAAIEVSIAMVGFAGIVAAVGRRGAGDWNPLDQLRLRILLTAGGVAGAFAFFPFVLLDTGLAPELCWRIGTGVMALWFIGIRIYRQRQATRMGLTPFMPLPFFLIVHLPIIMALAINTIWLGDSWPYVLGVVLQLFTAFITFVRLLLDS
ncbi:MAG: hypothetical protein JRG89_19555 [Deltaproteobacteria bacterium]|nr:hypothetical protein [Deltaproteobacteria bacterium]MBW2390604.1 hypothetical protein [Deltaproteobacteria bacterium]